MVCKYFYRRSCSRDEASSTGVNFYIKRRFDERKKKQKQEKKQILPTLIATERRFPEVDSVDIDLEKFSNDSETTIVESLVTPAQMSQIQQQTEKVNNCKGRTRNPQRRFVNNTPSYMTQQVNRSRNDKNLHSSQHSDILSKYYKSVRRLRGINLLDT